MSDTRIAGPTAAERPSDLAAASQGPPFDVLAAIGEQARRAPDAPALIDATGQATYAELVAEVDRMAGALAGSGVEPGDLVGLCLPRGRAAVTAMLAVLRAGAGYVPLDPGYPAARLALMLEDTRPRVVLVPMDADPPLPTGTPVLRLGEAGPATAPPPVDAASPDGPAYVIFTSGSTGRPKGVVVPRRGWSHFCRAARDEYGITQDDRVLQFASLSFDASVQEIFPALTAGAAVLVRDDDMISRPDLFLDGCADLGVTVLPLATAYWRELVSSIDRGEAALPASVRMVIIGGEAAHARTVERWHARVRRHVRLLNTYGPTEAIVTATAADLTSWRGDDPVPIGFPLPGVTCRVVTPHGAEAADGRPGELYIGGAALATGYLHRPELTAERFVSGPGGAPEYRTGDRVRRLPDGTLEYLGRFDRQVKIRGFRVEPAEVETALRGISGIADAVVLVDESDGQARLVGHLVADAGGPDAAEVRRRLSEQVPHYLVPAVISLHASFPLNVQGKVDRAALAAVPLASDGVAGREAGPQDTVEARVRALWESLLGVTGVGPADDFFALGADSLHAIRMISRLRHEYGAELALSELYAAPTFAEVVAAARAAEVPQDPRVALDTPERVSAEGPRVLPLTGLQRTFWMTEQLSAELPAYTLGIRYGWDGAARADLIEACLAELVRRHPALRARFPLQDGEPVMVVDPTGTVPLTEIDLRDLPREERASSAERVRRQAVREPMDLAEGPPARMVLLRTGGDDELFLVVHHLCFDGWSAGVLADELAELYHDLAEGREPVDTPPDRLPELGLRKESRAADTSLAAYWQDRFADADLDMELPADRSAPAVRSFAAERISRELPPALLDRLRSYGREHHASLFMVLLAGVQAVIGRYTGRDDVTVLAPVAGRDDVDLENLVGAALNILPLRGDVAGDPTFADLLSRVTESVVRDLEHQDLPLPDIMAAIGQARAGTTQAGKVNRLSGISVTVHNTPAPRRPLVRYAGDEPPAAMMVDLAFGLHFPLDGPVLTVDYATELFDAERVDALVDHLLTLLRAAVETPATPVSQLPLLTPVEQHRILREWNDGAIRPPVADTVHELFERCAASAPGAPALTSGPVTVSYRELNERANRLARTLRRHGVRPGVRVAICLDRDIELFVAMWAVLKAGGAYVPLDPAYPTDRLAYMVEDSGATALVTRTDLPAAPSPQGVAVVALDREAERILAESGEDPEAAAGPADPAYVIYTSGSTGRPKGVVVTHANLVHAVAMWQDAYVLEPGWTYQQAASFSFDMFVGETLRALCTGGRLVVVPREVLLDPAELYALMRREQVDSTELVPAVLRNLLAHVEAAGESLNFVRLLIGGGEKWQVREYRQAQRLVGPGNRVVNAYGVTEVTVDNVYFDGDAAGLSPDAPLPIGRPFPGNRVYILDAHGRPLPPGVVGELYLGGVGVALGYHERPELTAERFVPDPFGDEPEARMYRTGDSARYHRDGNVDFLGRLDDQVKVNGYRIELGEVETALAGLPEVLASAAAVHPLPSGIAQLVGYVVPRPGSEVTEAAVRETLSASLPVHMVPTRLVVLPRLPLTPNGKLDRRALPAPPASEAISAGAAPGTATERRVAAIWSETLGIDDFGVDDSFFSLGGDSFSALRLVRRVDPSLALVELYRQPTVRGLATLLDERSAEPDARPRRLLHRLTSSDADQAAGGVTVVAIPYSGGSAISYQPLAEALPAHWSLYAVELPGHDQSRPDELLMSTADVTELILAELRSLSGPVLLYGHCLGSAVTIEAARRAEEAGVEVVGVGLGASFPTARLPGRFFDWFYKLVPSDRFVSDREYASFLRARGGFTDLESPEQEQFVLRNVRHDARDAEEYFTAAYRGAGQARLRAPVLSVVGSRDRVTELYEERHHEWRHFADTVELAVLPRAGHFFVKTHAEPLARALVEHAERRLGEDAPRQEVRREPVDPPPVRGRVPHRAAPGLSRFALVALGQFVSMIGSSLSTLVLSIWVYQQTGSLTEFTLINAIGILPGIVAGPVAGAVADRWDRRRVMLISDSAAALAMGVLGLLVFAGGLRMWHIYLVVSVTSVAGAFQRPAYVAAVAQLVPKRYLGHANGITHLGMGLGTVIAPMIGAGLIGVIGIEGVVVLDVLSFLVGASALLAVRFPDMLFRQRDESFLKEITNGWRYIAQRPPLLRAMRFFVVHHVLYMIGFSVIVPMLLTEQSTGMLGVTLAAGGLGALCGSLAMGLWGGTPRRATGLIVALGVSGVGMFVTGIENPYLPAIGLFTIWFCDSIAEGHWLALVQTKVGMELQGRVLSLFMMTMMMTMPLGYLVMGPLAERHIQPLLEPGGALAATVGSVIGTGPGRGLALLVVLSGLLQLVWVIHGWRDRRLRFMEEQLPDAVPPADLGDLDDLQREADAQFTARPVRAASSARAGDDRSARPLV
ncbi:amino acid adenylation domain-containing protein [Streptosporangium sp. NPDC048865]|uniref:non-ribosomal peptide synthetase/MFS transporter n=1 Tax=Streptosporangium sp. NPDC048865 TaxID=3155766 RepID=UPI00344188E7